MPTRGEIGDLSNDLEVLRSNSQEPCHSWTDALPVCSSSGVGFATNQKYRIDGIRREEHAFEDKSFHFCCNENTYLYGVFDGHAGTRAVDFAFQRMPAEILLGQLSGIETDQEVQELLRQAFLAVERSFFESIDDLLADKERLRLQLQGLKTMEAINQYPDIVQRLKNVTEEIKSGTTAVIALILNSKLYIANVGNSRAVLCKKDHDGQIRIIPLTPDHTFENDDELLRLSHLGLDIQRMRHEMRNAEVRCTRCIGNYYVKGGYRECDYFSQATEEPVIAQPNIVGGIRVDDTCKFLILMSEGLYRSLEEATETPNSNALLVDLLLEQFQQESTLTGVAQAVVDKVVRIHHDAYMRDSNRQRCQKREDITLMVRNFNYPLPNAHNNNVINRTPTNQENNTLSDIISIPGSYARSIDPGATNPMFVNDYSMTGSSDSFERQFIFHPATDLSLDEDGRVKPYVDFSDVSAAIEEATNDGLIIKE